MGFAPANEPKIAIAVSVECTLRFGNDVAAPIFRRGGGNDPEPGMMGG